MLDDDNIVRGGNPSAAERIEQNIRKLLGGGRKRDALNREMRLRNKNKNFSLISQNCIGGRLYHDLGMQFLSPTVNLSFDGPDFIKFCTNLEYYLNEDLTEVKTDKVPFPVGRIADVEINFNHYASFAEARDKWNIRRKRVNYSEIYVIATDRDGMTLYDGMEKFDKIKYPKLMFTAKPYEQYDWARFCDKWSNKNQVGVLTGFADLQGHRFYEKYADILSFLNPDGNNRA